ncbi:trihelix transcription factor ENAP1-like [Rutidosis leptorrhynchoides]|uniref:trihelix transcription factor ENAP1-like n=1 Tax=Rutidosis leptorrhynchoides TaxID=125765 RepID=UPI003A98F579
MAPTPPPAPPVPKQSFGGRNSLTDWSERETFVLLDAWGDKFLQRGRKSLRSEEWHEVAEKVSEISKVERTDTQCRNRLDTLKKKYKKEKVMMSTSKWVYFKKMDMLLSSSSSSSQSQPQTSGLDSGEYVFKNPKLYLNNGNGLDEMRDSPGNSESTDREDEDSDGLPPKKRKLKKKQRHEPLGMLADSIHKFSDMYEKIEKSRRQQMVELETMRMDIQRELEMHKRQIMESAQAQIVNIQHGDDDHNDDNASG